MNYDGSGVRATMLRGGTSRGCTSRGAGPPGRHAARDDLLMRLMGTPDPRQIDGLAGRRR
jgi:4-oxalomesaconate tautomerase